MKLHIKKGDMVKVLCGDDRGVVAQVLRVFPRKQTAIVEGVRLVSKHMKPSQQHPNGSVVRQEAPIHISNLMLIDPSDNTPTRIGRQKAEKGYVRVSKKSGEIIP